VTAIGPEVLRVIAQRFWPPDRSVFLDRTKTDLMPTLVFPVFATLVATGLLTESVGEDVAADAADGLAEDLTRSEMAVSDKLVVELLLAHLLQRALKDGRFSASRVGLFADRVSDLISVAAQRAVTPMLSNFDVLINRFATARFDMEMLLTDFKRVLDATRRLMKFPAALTACLYKKLVVGLDARMTTRICANPQRINFTNGVLWNSCVAALERAEHFRLPNSSEVASAIVMAQNLATAGGPEVRRTLLAEMSEELLAFLMVNFAPDEMCPDGIHPRAVFTRLDISANGQSKPRITPREEPEELKKVADHWDVEAWRRVHLPEAALAEFPFLAAVDTVF
jgi:hypothetical protein